MPKHLFLFFHVQEILILKILTCILLSGNYGDFCWLPKNSYYDGPAYEEGRVKGSDMLRFILSPWEFKVFSLKKPSRCIIWSPSVSNKDYKSRRTGTIYVGSSTCRVWWKGMSRGWIGKKGFKEGTYRNANKLSKARGQKFHLGKN